MVWNSSKELIALTLPDILFDDSRWLVCSEGLIFAVFVVLFNAF